MTKPTSGTVAAAPRVGKRESSARLDWTGAAIIVGLAALVIATFWPVATFEFVNYDDHLYLTDHPRVQQGLTPANIAWAFTQSVGYWDPIDLISHMLDCQVFGMNAGGHHAANLLYHTVNVLLLFGLLRKITGQRWPSALVAALFAIHPQNVEPVAWISGRRDVLSTLFGLLALGAYARYVARSSRVRYAVMLALLALSLMVKPAFMPFAAVLFFLDYWPLRRMDGYSLRFEEGRKRWIGLVVEKLPVFALVLAVAAVDFVTQGRTGALASSAAHPFVSRLGNAAYSYVSYIGKIVWPTGLAACYPYPSVSNEMMAGAIALLAGVTVAAVVCRRRYPYLFVGWFWYALVLTPVCGVLVQVGNAPRANRYAYVSTIGLFIAVSWGLASFARNARTARVAAVVAVACVAVFATAASRQAYVWHDSATLFKHAIKAVPDNYMAHAFMGTTLAEQGRDEEAIAEYREALRIAPHYLDARCNLANLLHQNGRDAEALTHYEEALRGNPHDPLYLYNTGLCLINLGRVEEAIARIREALAAKPDIPLAHNSLGYALACKGQFDAAIAEYRLALEAEPKSALALCNMGNALAALKRFPEACEYYAEALKASPGNASIQSALDASRKAMQAH